MPQLDVSTYLSQLFWLAVTFTFLYMLVKAVILPKVGQTLENRHRRIAEDHEMAERLQRQAREIMEQTEALLAETRARAQTIVREEKEKVSAEIEAMRKEMEAALADRIARAEAELQAAKQAALRELEGAVGELAAEIAEKVAGKKPSTKVLQAAVSRLGEEG